MVRLSLVVGVGVGAIVLAASACGNQAGPRQELDVISPGPGSANASPTVTTTAGPAMSGADLERPPPFRLRYDGKELALLPHTWCFHDGCVDGAAQDPPSVGDPAAIRIFVPVEDWKLTATFSPAGKRCGRQQSVEPTEDDGWYTLRPAGSAGAYDVQLFAQGGGDMVAGFRWDTPRNGALATPAARLALIADHDGQPDSYGVELMLENLAETPRSASARITVTAGNGRSLTFDATRAAPSCWPEGTVYFDGPDAQGQAAAALGDAPFHYDVTVTIDGATYRASADYPADEIAGNEPSVHLTFTPPLPALS